MSAPADSLPVVSRWDDGHAATLAPAERLLYRSNLLGGDARITGYGGGGTSAKLGERDRVTGVETEVLWVKGAGGDLGSMKLDGFATLNLDRLVALKALFRGPEHEDEMVALLAHCAFGANRRTASIDTPLHAFLPHPHVDHVHPDTVLAIAAAKNSRELTLEIYGETIGWLPWRPPGFALALALEKFAHQSPAATGAVLEGRGLVTWAADARACYQTTIATINAAITWFAEKAGSRPAFLGARFALPAAAARRAAAARLMPEIRARIGRDRRQIGHFDDSPAVLEFVNSEQFRQLAPLGPPSPAHLLRTKIRPLVIEPDAKSGALDRAISTLDQTIADHRAAYAAYYERCKHPGGPAMGDPDPAVCLVPGIGMITLAGDKATARIAGAFYRNAIAVMRAAAMIDTYVGLSERATFDIEYGLHHEAELPPRPAPNSLTGRVALVTGGAGDIGRAIATRLLGEGAAVVVTDGDAGALAGAAAALADTHGADNLRAIHTDATDEDAMARAFAEAAIEYGGLDILVCNAAVSASAPIAETTLAVWSRDTDILARSYLLPSREAFGAMKRNQLGGAIVFVATPSGLAGMPATALASATRAAVVHFARGLAEEGAADGIRVNVVNAAAMVRSAEPDAKPASLPHDVAEAVYFLASDMAARSTGNVIDVGAGRAGRVKA